MDKESYLPHDWFPGALPPNITISEKSWIYSAYAFIHYRSLRSCGVKIGHDTGVYHGTFFDLGPCGEVEIGNYCSLVGAIFSTNGRIAVGSYTFIAHEVVFADSFAAVPRRPEAMPLRADGDQDEEPLILVGENVWIGARAVVLAPARIGEGAIIGAGAIVNADVPAFSIVAGNPAKVVGRTEAQ